MAIAIAVAIAIAIAVAEYGKRRALTRPRAERPPAFIGTARPRRPGAEQRRCRGKDRRVNVEHVQFTLKRTPFTDAVAQALCEEVQAEYTIRYGGGDDTRIELNDFDPPDGDFIVAFDADGEPIGCGGWRAHEDGDAEMKRVYVRGSARRRGLARLIVAAIEDSAAAAGRKRVVLETGPRQPEAIAMYEALGYRPITPFGYYAGADGSLHLGKELRSEEQ